MPDKALRMLRADQQQSSGRPVVLAIAGDSAAGKTTLTRGLVDALGGRATAICVDDYHRYDREERKDVPFTPLHPDCNYVEIMEQHLQLLATGQPVLKPVYDHGTGQLIRPELVEPQEFLIVEGLLPLHSKLSRACFDIKVFLDPPEQVRRGWKVRRDTTQRGYTEEQVLADLDRREPDAAAFIRPQREYADIVVRFAPVEGRDEPETPLSSLLLLRPTIRHPDISALLDEDNRAMHLKLIRDDDNRPVDALHVHGYVPAEESDALQRAIWRNLSTDEPLPAGLGAIGDDARSAPLAMTQLLLLYHLLDGLA
jgi:phosphoribulokinase